MAKILEHVGSLCLFLYVWTAICFGACIQVLSLVLIRPFSRKTHANFMYYIQGTFLTNISFFLERNGNLNLELTGDKMPNGENCLVLPNHQNHDWGHIYTLANRRRNLGAVRTVLKKVTQYIPGFGTCMWLNNWPFVSRDWKQDSVYLKKLYNMYKEDDMPLVLWIFPEGTRITPKKLKKSQEYAAKNGKPNFNHVMLPRYKAVISALRSLPGVVDYVYETTIAYSGWEGFPGFGDLVFNDPNKEYTLHMNVKRVELKSIDASSEESVKKWLVESFTQKDANLAHFEKHGHFPGEITKEAPLPFSEYIAPLSLWALISVVGWTCVYQGVSFLLF
jgi:1-acyl-sn-glycerol-3-phosphate acyltransferase